MNHSASESELFEMMQLWQLKGLTFEDAIAIIPLPKPYLGDYMPAVDDYVTGECFVLNTNKQFTRGEALAYLAKLWGDAYVE